MCTWGRIRCIYLVVYYCEDFLIKLTFSQEVLKQLQGSIEDEAMASSGQIDLLERLKGKSRIMF